MKKLLPILLLLLCSACGTTQREFSAPRPGSVGPQNDAMNDLAIYAMSLADTPYRYGGNSPVDGFDCSGFVRYVFEKSLEWKLPRTTQEMSRMGEQLEEDQLRPGDLVFFNTQQHPYSHVGIYVGDNRFVHAPKSGKSITVANMREHYWRVRYDGARRIRQPR